MPQTKGGSRLPTGGSPQTVSLLDRFRVLLRYKVLLVAVTLMAGAGSYAWFSSRTTLYRAEAVMLATDTTAQTDPFSAALNTPAVEIQDRDVATQIQILESPAIRTAVRAKFPQAPKAYGVQVGSTNEFAVEVTDHDPVLAAKAATEYARDYIAFQREQSVADDSAAAASVSAQVSALQSQLDAVQAQILHMAPGDPHLALLQQHNQNLLAQQSVFQQKLDELNVDVELKSSPAELVAPSVVPSLPVSPRVRRDTILITVGALVLACAAVFGIDYVDDRITSREGIEAASGAVPILGFVPRVPAVRGRSSPIKITTAGPTSGLAESFRSLRTNVQFLNVEDDTTSILVTSPSASEGKTTVAANLAVTLGRAGLRVLLVDADLRRPALRSFFALGESPGLSGVLAGTVDWRQAVQPLPGEPNVEVMTAGGIPPNPSELLGSERARHLLDELGSLFDQVIVDTPPSLPVTDAVSLSQRVDACLLVVLAGVSKKRQVARCAQLLRQVNAPLAGVVVNGLSNRFDDGYGYGYGYGYRYGSEEKATTSGRGRGRTSAGAPRSAAEVAVTPGQQPAPDPQVPRSDPTPDPDFRSVPQNNGWPGPGTPDGSRPSVPTDRPPAASAAAAGRATWTLSRRRKLPPPAP